MVRAELLEYAMTRYAILLLVSACSLVSEGAWVWGFLFMILLFEGSLSLPPFSLMILILDKSKQGYQ